MSMYESYQQSKIDWLPVIPSTWVAKRIKNLFTLRDERSYKPLSEVNLISLYTSLGVRQHSDIEHTTGNKARNADGYKIVNVDDIVVNIMLCWMGAIGRSAYSGVTSPAYDIYKPHEEVNSSYYHYLFRTPIFSKQCFRNGHGIMMMRWRTYSPEFTSIVVPVPPREEQDQIVRFLDWKVSEINRLINIKKRRLAIVQELIDKQFRILSSQAIQKTKLKYIVDLCQDFIEINPSDYYYKTGMYNRGRGIFRREAMLGEDMGDSSFQKIHSGCVMISGQFAWEAATYITAEEDKVGVVSHRYYLLKSNSDIPPEYIWAFLISDYGQMLMKSCSHGAAGRNRPLNIKELMNEYIPVPDSTHNSEMKALVNSVQEMMQLRKVTLKEENLLTEMRSRLISDVVTGKMDVRGIEVPQYEYISEEMDEMMKDKIDDTEEELNEE